MMVVLFPGTKRSLLVGAKPGPLASCRQVGSIQAAGPEKTSATHRGQSIVDAQAEALRHGPDPAVVRSTGTVARQVRIPSQGWDPLLQVW